MLAAWVAIPIFTAGLISKGFQRCLKWFLRAFIALFEGLQIFCDPSNNNNMTCVLFAYLVMITKNDQFIMLFDWNAWNKSPQAFLFAIWRARFVIGLAYWFSQIIMLHQALCVSWYLSVAAYLYSMCHLYCTTSQAVSFSRTWVQAVKTEIWAYKLKFSIFDWFSCAVGPLQWLWPGEFSLN